MNKTVSLGSIFYRGYLLKRSNQPLSVSELEQWRRNESTDQSYEELTCNVNENIHEIDEDSTEEPTHFPFETCEDESLQGSPRKKSISQLEAFFGISQKSTGNNHGTSVPTYSTTSKPTKISETKFQSTDIPTTSSKSSSDSTGNIVKLQERIKIQHDHIPTQPISIINNNIENRDEGWSKSLKPSSLSKELTGERTPIDFVADDGHIWRAKYCIFTEGVLYFYQNKEDADSLEAQTERDCDLNGKQQYEPSFDLLSKSPMPRSFMNIPPHAKPSNLKHVIWEKRVALENVGACRSSVEEYGPNSFVLLTHECQEDSNSPVDMLVLKAGSSKEMDEWMLQFQRSIASLMRKMILSVDSSTGSSLSHQYTFNNHLRHTLSSPKTLSPMHQAKSASPSLPPFLSLSHGHGRNDLHRRLLLPKDKQPQQLSITKGESISDQISIGMSALSLSTGKPEESSPRLLSKPAPTAKKYIPPHLRAKIESGGKYIPPHLRKKLQDPIAKKSYEDQTTLKTSSSPIDFEREDQRESNDTPPIPIQIILGGCAEVTSSGTYRRNKFKAQSFGSFGGSSTSLKWEVGAISELGKRDSNEDAFVCVSNFPKACNRDEERVDINALFAVFDGHCGSTSAKFAANNIVTFLEEAWQSGNVDKGNEQLDSSEVQGYLKEAIARLDHEICCKSEWESGSTAIVAMVVGDQIVLANVGDCRGVLCCKSTQTPNNAKWKVPELNNEEDFYNRSLFYREIARTHNPYREDEKARIESANGWITREQEVCISQLQRVDLFDKDVVDILKRCFSERLSGSNLASYDGEFEAGTPTRPAPGRVFYTSRVCGELAVSRALGDKDFKSRYSKPTVVNGEDCWWEGPNFLPYPLDHNMCFKNDLITSIPDIETFTVGENHVCDEFLILACDGLWDVMDPDDAVIVAHDLLFKKAVSAEIAVRA